MTGNRKRNMGYPGRFRRRVRKTFINIVFAPARIPRITVEMVDMLMKLAEIAAMSFVVILIAHIVWPEAVAAGLLIVVGAIFALLVLLIKLSDYQEKIEQYRYYGFRL